MKILNILMGPPGSGKSSIAASLVEGYNHVRISQDDQGKKHLELFKQALADGKHIVVDRMNFDKQQRARYINPAKELGYSVTITEVVVPRTICYYRCINRVGHPTINKGFLRGVHIENETISNSANSALHTYFSRYEEVTEDEGELLRIKHRDELRPSAIMVDIDGTLANIDHRLHHVKNGKKDWGKFFAEVELDSVYEDVRGILELEHQAGTRIILCSGRPEDQCRVSTLRWLENHQIPFDDLVMRPRGNYKSDDIAKAMLYRYEIQPYYRVKYVLDDRDQVVNKWRSMGLNCMQVRPGDF